MGSKAKDVMQTNLVRVGVNTPLSDLTRIFVEEEISGAPVVDDTDRLVGVVSMTDILRILDSEQESASGDGNFFRDSLEYASPEWAGEPDGYKDRLSELTVGDAMQTSVVAVSEDAEVSEVAKQMRTNRIHRVLVVRGEWPVGLVSSFDLMGLLE